MARALRAVRDCVQASKSSDVQISNGNVILPGGAQFEANVKTPFKNAHTSSLYVIGTVAYFAKWFGGKDQTSEQWAQYIKDCRKINVNTVAYQDGWELGKYLKGMSDGGDNVDLLHEDLVEQAADHSEEDRNEAVGIDGAHQVGASTEAARPLRTRLTVIQPPGGPTFTNIASLLKKSKARSAEEEDPNAQGKSKKAKKQERERSNADDTSTSQAKKQMGVPSNRFNRVEEKQFYRDQLGKEVGDLENLGINPNASFLAPQKAQPSRDPHRQRNDNASSQARHGRHRQQAQQQAGQRSQAQGTAAVAAQSQQASAVPLILVPQSMSTNTLVNMHNVKKFLEQGKYVPWNELWSQNVKKDKSCRIERTIGRERAIPYEVSEVSPNKNDSDGWGRVVAAFVSGAKWQFKGWPFPGAEGGVDMVEAFNRIRGIYIRFEGDSLPEQVSSWNVKILTIPKHERHSDRAVAKEAWASIDRLLASRRSSLAY